MAFELKEWCDIHLAIWVRTCQASKSIKKASRHVHQVFLTLVCSKRLRLPPSRSLICHSTHHIFFLRPNVPPTTQSLPIFPVLALSHLQDTAGQEQFARLTSFYARDAAAAVLAYDLTDRQSFEDIPKWYNYVTESRRNNKEQADCVVILAGAPTKAEAKGNI